MNSPTDPASEATEHHLRLLSHAPMLADLFYLGLSERAAERLFDSDLVTLEWDDKADDVKVPTMVVITDKGRRVLPALNAEGEANAASAETSA